MPRQGDVDFGIYRATRRGLATPQAVLRELAGAARIAADLRSFSRIAVDVICYRLLRVVDLPRHNSVRRVRLRGNVRLAYRLNRGDLVALRESWMDESYKLPFKVEPGSLIDLGANIGLTSVWLARHYGFRRLIAVEPLPDNVRLLRENFATNGLQAKIVEAAVGPARGRVWFEPAASFTEGRVSKSGGAEDSQLIRMTTMDDLLALTAEHDVDLLKLDIEGGEEALLTGDRHWLARVRSIIVEFHPWLVDYAGLIKLIESEGFRYLPAGTVHRESMDGFVRRR